MIKRSIGIFVKTLSSFIPRHQILDGCLVLDHPIRYTNQIKLSTYLRSSIGDRKIQRIAYNVNRALAIHDEIHFPTKWTLYFHYQNQYYVVNYNDGQLNWQNQNKIPLPLGGRFILTV